MNYLNTPTRRRVILYGEWCRALTDFSPWKINVEFFKLFFLDRSLNRLQFHQSIAVAIFIPQAVI